MAKCDYCGAEIEGLPFKCKYCGGVFCVHHHLPEEHDCPGLYKAQSPDAIERGRPILSAPVEAAPRVRARPFFYSGELRDIAIGVAAVTIAAMPSYSLTGLLYGLLIALLAYLPHELAHKLAAEYFGNPARYVIWPWGLLLTLISAIPFMPIGIIVPGYVLIASPGLSAREEELISAAGPLTNIAVATLALVVAPLTPIARRLAYFSAIVAVLNLLPFGPLDGRKVLRANFLTWLILFGAATALLLIAL
ncbi:MAG: AN1-type zinc finger domain-containing protein [Thermofilaceae archaeon]